MTRALILSGHGRYADPWHPFPETSKRLADLLAECGLTTEITGEVDERMADLAYDRPGLLVVNVGDPALNAPDEPQPDAEAHGRRGLLDYLATGRPLLGIHTAATTFRGVPEWRSILGGIWIRGESYHPPYAHFEVRVHSGKDSLAAGLTDFSIADERYSNLSCAGGNIVFARHIDDSGETPLAWHRFYGSEQAKVIYDALGHDTASYDSEGHRALLKRSIDWLLA